jgi:hypothetical protein
MDQLGNGVMVRWGKVFTWNIHGSARKWGDGEVGEGIAPPSTPLSTAGFWSLD